LANRTLALHLPGGRQLFVTTGGALWTQQRSSGVCYKRRRKEEDEGVPRVILYRRRGLKKLE